MELKESSIKKFAGVRRKKGKYCAEIKDPFLKKRVWLGTFNTPEDASEAYIAKKLKIEKKLRAKQGLNRAPHDENTSILKSHEEIIVEFKESSIKKFAGVRILRGKYCAEIKDPFLKKRVGLGTFSTPEEASEAYIFKKRKIEQKQRAKQGIITHEKTSSMEDSSPSSVLEGFGENKVLDTHIEDEFGCLNGVRIIDTNGFFVGEFAIFDECLNFCLYGKVNVL